MQKRQYLKRNRGRQQSPDCIICQLKTKIDPTLRDLPSKILTSKYYQQPERIKQAISIKELITQGPSTSLRIGYREALQQTKSLEVIKNYEPFHSIVTKIKPLILQRVGKDLNSTVHFTGKIYQMTMHRFLSHKLLAIGKVHTKKWQPKNGSGASTDSDHHSSPNKGKKLLIRKLSPRKQNDTMSMRRLTRNLSKMVRGFEQNFYMHPSQIFDLLEAAPRHVLDETKLAQRQIFNNSIEANISGIARTSKNEIKANISAIAKKVTLERLHTVDSASEHIDDHYGFKPKPKLGQPKNINTLQHKSHKKLRKIQLGSFKQNVSPNTRVQTDYDYQTIKKAKRQSLSSKRNPRLKPVGLDSLSRGKGSTKKSMSKVRSSRKL